MRCVKWCSMKIVHTPESSAITGILKIGDVRLKWWFSGPIIVIMWFNYAKKTALSVTSLTPMTNRWDYSIYKLFAKVTIFDLPRPIIELPCRMICAKKCCCALMERHKMCPMHIPSLEKIYSQVRSTNEKRLHFSRFDVRRVTRKGSSAK